MKLWQGLLLLAIGILAAAFLFSLVMIAVGPRM